MLPRDDPSYWGRLGAAALSVIGEPNGYATYFVQGPDGRRIAVEAAGAADGYTVILCPGSLSDERGIKPDHAVLESLGINLVTIARPGYGWSDPQPGRRPVDTVAAVQRVVEELGIELGLSVVGRSAGGPHTLACAAHLPGVRNAAVLGSPAPLDALPELGFDGLAEANADDERTRAAGELAGQLAARASQIQLNPLSHLEALRPSFAPDDHRVVQGAYERRLVETWRSALRFGASGWIGDSFGEADWGFDPCTDIAVPVCVVYGDDDRFVRPPEGEWLARSIPTAQEVRMPGAGHFRLATDEVVLPVLGWCATDELLPNLALAAV